MYDFSEQPPIIYLHSVAPAVNPDWIRSYLTLELVYFEDILKYIQRNKYKTFFISELNNRDFQKDKSIGISFDDGYLDNYVYAFPLLKKYKIKATIFCAPAYIEKVNISRPTIEDVWNGIISEKEIKTWGFCNSEELRIMQESGFVDIQSHTLTHDKYPVSDSIIGFHNPNNKNFNFYFSEHPGIKPIYVTKFDPDNSAIPYGLPLYEEKSSVISPRVWINKDFNDTIVEELKETDWNKYNFIDLQQKIKPIIHDFRRRDQIIIKREMEDEYTKRVSYEIFQSRQQLEQLLNKKITSICWPHGDFNILSTELAREAGYKNIHFVETKSHGVIPGEDHFVRIGMDSVKNNRFLTHQKIKIRINNARRRFPYPYLSAIKKVLKY